jgi:hypothetical protein
MPATNDEVPNVQGYQDQGQQEYKVDTGTFFTDNAPSWSELAELLDKRMQETGERRRFSAVYAAVPTYGPLCDVESFFCAEWNNTTWKIATNMQHSIVGQATSTLMLTRRMGRPMRGRCGACSGSRARPS